MPNPEDRPLVPSSGIAASPVERSKHFFQHLLQKRQLRRDRQTLEEITKNTRAAAEAARAVGDLEKERNRAALQAGRATHVPPRLEAEESEYHATTAENQARRAEAEGRRAAALRSAEASSQPRSSVADDLTKRMEKLTRRFEQQNKQGADREALTAWARGSWGADIDFLRARGDEVGAQRLEQQLQHILDDIATGEA